MSPTELTPTPVKSAIKAVGPLPPPIVPPQPETDKPNPPKPATPPIRTDASLVAVAIAPAPQGLIYQPIDIACPHQNDDLTNCGAAENEQCSWQQSGMAGTYHAERIANAAAASRGNGILPTEQEFKQAAEDSGLF